MKLEHRFTVPAAFDVVWAALDDLESLVPCVPGATLTSVDGDDFTGTVKVKLGPISMTYSGTGRFVERDRDSGRVVVEAKGKDKRGNGTAGATVVAQITADGDATAIEVTTDLTVTGKPAQFGRGVIQDVSDTLLKQFVDCVSVTLAPAAADVAPAAAEVSAADAGVSAVSGGEAAGGVVSAGEVASPNADAAGSVTASGGAADVPAGARAGAAAGAGGRPAAAAPSTPPRASSASPAPAAEIDLLGTVMPVLVRRYAIQAVLLAVVVAVVALCRRRGRRRRR